MISGCSYHDYEVTNEIQNCEQKPSTWCQENKVHHFGRATYRYPYMMYIKAIQNMVIGFAKTRGTISVIHVSLRFSVRVAHGLMFSQLKVETS
jgi:hypothetical protein